MLGSIGSQDGDVVQSLRKQLDEAQRLLAQKDGEVKDMEAKMFEQKASTSTLIKVNNIRGRTDVNSPKYVRELVQEGSCLKNTCYFIAKIPF